MEQTTIFDMLYQPFKIDKPIRLIELFAGVGSQAMALRDLGADFESYRVVEFDRFAIKSYNAIHGTDFLPTDITQINGKDLGITQTDRYCYICTYSFPCQDLSVAGRKAGMKKGDGTRSGLLWEVERLLDETEELPQVLLMENVPMVHSKDNIEDFEKWIRFLESKGYTNFYKDLNAKDYGIAQNRERCFMVSLLGEYNYKFPEPVELENVMADYLEKSVEEKYYINNEKSRKLIDTLYENGTIPQSRAEQSYDYALTCQPTNREESILPTVSQREKTEVSASTSQRVTVLLKNQGGELERFTDTATTLMARDYKGFGNQITNGVIEIWN